MRRSRKSKTRRRGVADESAPATDADDPDALEPVDDDELQTLEPIDDDELQTLEPVDDGELDTLEPWDGAEADGSRVTITHESAPEDHVDVRLDVAVAGMEKSAVTEAVEVPLRAKVAELESALRFKRVVVEFTGDTLIPSAAKDRVGELLAAAKPLSVKVRRGYGDELVHRGTAPTVEMTVTPVAGEASHVRVEFDTGGLETRDLPAALGPGLDKLRERAADTTIDVAFTGAAQPDATTREVIRAALAAAGAERVTVVHAGSGRPDVIHDRALESRVVVRAAEPGAVDVDVAPADDADATCAAIALVLPREREQIRGARVHVRFADRAPRAAEIQSLAALAAELGPRSLQAQGDLLWPSLLAVARDGDATTLTVNAHGRDRESTVAAFRREAESLAEAVEGQTVTVDWPSGFETDVDVDACVEQCLSPHRPARIAYTFGSEDREPVVPAPLWFHSEPDGGPTTCDLDADAGKPAELVRAIHRRVRAAARAVAGQRVQIRVVGSGTVSRTMQRTLRDELDAAGAAHVEIDDRGNVEVLLPRLLAAETLPDGGVRVRVEVGGRAPEQIEGALADELGELGVAAGATVRVSPSAADDAVIAALVQHGAGRVLLEREDRGPATLVHPPLFDAPERDGDALTLRAIPDTEDADQAASIARVERELPRVLAAGAGLGDVAVTLHWPGAAGRDAPVARAIGMLVAAGPASLVLDRGDGAPEQVHPEPEPEPEPEPALEPAPELSPEPVAGALSEPIAGEIPEPVAGELPEPIAAAGGLEPVRPPVELIGRKDDATPPLSMIAVAWSEDPAHVASVRDEIVGMLGDLEAQRVLVVFRAGDREVQGRVDDALVRAVREILEPSIEALLLFRTAPGGFGDHFEVVHSRIDGLPVGTRVRDPRTRS